MMKFWMAAFGVLGTSVLGIWRSQYERNHFVVEETEICSSKIKTPKTLVFLSDLHDKEFGNGNQNLLRAVENLHPDAVLIGGDTMVAKPGKADLQVTERLLCGLNRMEAEKGGIPIYYGNGNHEQRLQREADQYPGFYQEFLALLKTYHVHYLSDSSEVFGDDICISGLNLRQAHYRDLIPEKLKESEIEKKLGKADRERFQILLAHSPLFHKAYGHWGADLALAGHFHGGTIRLPLLGGVMTPQFQFFLPCCGGNFVHEGHHMIVSRGLGTHSINLRLNNVPQIVAVRLTSAPVFTDQR